LEINKTVIVASSCSSIFTLPTLMIHGQKQIKCNCPALVSQDLQRESKSSFSPRQRKRLIYGAHLLIPCKGIITVCFKTDNKITRGENAQFLIPVKVVDIVKQSKGIPRQAEVALGVPGRLRPRIFSTFGTTKVVDRQPYASAAFTPG
jgi:hypothetical protein